MNVVELRAECAKAMISETGRKSELAKRLLKHHGCNVIPTQVVTGKHKAKWQRRRFPSRNQPFTNETFNVDSLTKMLPSFPDKMPSPNECYDVYFTDEMWELGRSCTNVSLAYFDRKCNLFLGMIPGNPGRQNGQRTHGPSRQNNLEALWPLCTCLV